MKMTLRQTTTTSLYNKKEKYVLSGFLTWIASLMGGRKGEGCTVLRIGLFLYEMCFLKDYEEQ